MLWDLYDAVHATWFGQTSQTKKFGALPLNRSANTDLRRTREKLHPVDLFYRRADGGRWKVNDLLAAARVSVEIGCAENLNARGKSGWWRAGLIWTRRGGRSYRDKYVSAIIRNQTIIWGSECRIELRTRRHPEWRGTR